MIVYITSNIIARIRQHDGTDIGSCSLNPGKYNAHKTYDGALEIVQESGEPAYLLPFIWWEKMELGELVVGGSLA